MVGLAVSLAPLQRLFGKQPLVSQVNDLEYRTCAAGSAAEARLTAEQLMGQRTALLRRFAQRH